MLPAGAAPFRHAPKPGYQAVAIRHPAQRLSRPIWRSFRRGLVRPCSGTRNSRCAVHARDGEAHVAACPRCATAVRDYSEMRAAMSGSDLRYVAPASLRARINGMLPAAAPRASNRWNLFNGFMLGGALSATAAASL